MNFEFVFGIFAVLAFLVAVAWANRLATSKHRSWRWFKENGMLQGKLALLIVGWLGLTSSGADMPDTCVELLFDDAASDFLWTCGILCVSLFVIRSEFSK